MAALEGPLQASWWRGDLVRVSQAPIFLPPMVSSLVIKNYYLKFSY